MFFSCTLIAKGKVMPLKPLPTSNPNKSNCQPDEILEHERPESELKLVEIPGIFADETSLSVVGLVTIFVVVTFYDTPRENHMYEC